MPVWIRARNESDRNLSGEMKRMSISHALTFSSTLFAEAYANEIKYGTTRSKLLLARRYSNKHHEDLWQDNGADPSLKRW